MPDAIQPGSRIAMFDDPEAFGAHVHHAVARVLPLSAGGYRARVTLVQLPSIGLAMGEESLPRLYESETSPDRIYFRLRQTADPTSRLNGVEHQPGRIRIRRPGQTVVDVSPGPAVIRSMSLPIADLAARADRTFGRPPPVLLDDCVLIRPAPGRFARLAALQRDVFRLAAERPAALAHRPTAAALDAQLGEALLAILFESAPERDTAAACRGHAIMARVLDRIGAEPNHAFTLAELCGAGGCSAKTLEVLFRARMGTTPNRFLRLRRLWAVRRALLAADPRMATVSQLAMDGGFWELGRFAAVYRAQFGESPSQTLQRRVDSARPEHVSPSLRRPAALS
ncbi:helix-turn-helix domain-containing protein [Roseomonas sp. CAU 1739]|uniref:helix-turn-helix domain-containing protein n=1 Tax=Roseomonas sp. CAU 1739 TaxID=3140364 RepID=UPI00325ADDD7